MQGNHDAVWIGARDLMRGPGQNCGRPLRLWLNEELVAAQLGDCRGDRIHQWLTREHTNALERNERQDSVECCFNEGVVTRERQ